jgi:hypothetical protein
MIRPLNPKAQDALLELQRLTTWWQQQQLWEDLYRQTRSPQELRADDEAQGSHFNRDGWGK